MNAIMKTRANSKIICSGSNRVPAGMNMTGQGVPGAQTDAMLKWLESL